MTIHSLHAAPAEDLSRRLTMFERQFEYPLGSDNHFRISHGSDYTRFFRAMGEATCLVAEHAGRVSGTLGLVRRRVLAPDGGEIFAHYVCDLKIAPTARGGVLLRRLFQAATAGRDITAPKVFSVVMDGTAVNPLSYTGRLGIPRFEKLAEVIILRIPVESLRGASPQFEKNASHGAECFRRLSSGRYASLCGNPAERSQLPPIWLRLGDDSAAGLLEDTLRAKRLSTRDGAELISAHLSCFAFATPAAGARLIQAAMRLSHEQAMPALFAAIARKDAPPILAALDREGIACTGATVYGVGLEPGADWNINTAEI